MIRRLSWVTASGARGLDEDEPLALEVLTRLGVQVDVLDWDDSTVNWANYDRVVLRSAWDYAERLDEFLGWVETVDAITDLRNPRPMIGWSVDKHYLLDLAAAGVAIVPTAAVEVGEQPALPAGDVVVKPAVGAGSRDVACYELGDSDRARAHVRRLHGQGRAVLVQPQLASVADLGEWPMIYFGGEYSHAASKRVRLTRGSSSVEGLFATEENAPHVQDPDQLAVAAAAISYVTERFGVPTYARVDLVRDNDGRPCVLELELVEPSLFLMHADRAAPQRLAHVLTS